MTYYIEKQIQIKTLHSNYLLLGQFRPYHYTVCLHLGKSQPYHYIALHIITYKHGEGPLHTCLMLWKHYTVTKWGLN